jgi:hypothetical protein
MSGWSVFWAGLKGLLTPGSSMFESIAELALDTVNSALARISSLPLACERVKAALKVLMDYADWCPQKWRADFDVVCGIVGRLAEALSDSKIELSELQTVISDFREAYAEWFAED